MRCQMRFLLPEVSVNGDMHQVSTLNNIEQFCSPNELHVKFLKWLAAIRRVSWRAKEGEAVDAVHQQEMIVASHCKSRNGGHITVCQRNLAILAAALPANPLPSAAAILDWHRSHVVAELCFWPYDSSSA